MNLNTGTKDYISNSFAVKFSNIIFLIKLSESYLINLWCNARFRYYKRAIDYLIVAYLIFTIQ
jgi:hypothetical protein